MMKDMKWKQIDTTYAGKAYQVEAEEINLHGEVNIQGSLSVNGSPLDTPTAAGTSYDNTASGLTADDVQEAIDEVAGKLVSTIAKSFTNYTFNTQSGSLYMGDDIVIDTTEDFTNKPFTITVAGGAICWACVRSVSSTSITVVLLRQVTGTISGNIYIMG